MIANGLLMPGQKLPTVRQLAADLGLAPNTVARAYRELEADNIITTHGRRGTFVRSKLFDTPTHSDGVTSSQAAAMQFASSVRRNGLNLSEATRLVEAAWIRSTA